MRYHEPVLLKETIEALALRSDGIYVDATAGGGGHVSAIAERLDSEGVVIGIDRDPQAIEQVRDRLKGSRVRSIIEQSRFSEFEVVLDKHGITAIDGLLLDLGVSSHQIDAPERGFSYMKEAPLDMRMDSQRGRTAHDILQTASDEELADILGTFGEIRNPLRMARALIKYRGEHHLVTSTDLNDCLSREYGPHLDISVYARVYQALRIAVNSELEELETVLVKAVDRLRSKGRIVVISYHSLEDRIVKNFIRTREQSCICPPHVPRCTCGQVPQLKRITKKPTRPGEEELRRNPRSRSARMRVAEKVA